MTKASTERDGYDFGGSRWRHGRHTSVQISGSARQRSGDAGTRHESNAGSSSGDADASTEAAGSAWPCYWT